MLQYFRRCESQGIEFVPLVVDTFGGWHEASIAAIKRLGKQVGRAVGKEESEAVSQLRQRLAVMLAKDNASMITARAPTVTPADIDGDADE